MEWFLYLILYPNIVIAMIWILDTLTKKMSFLDRVFPMLILLFAGGPIVLMTYLEMVKMGIKDPIKLDQEVIMNAIKTGIIVTVAALVAALVLG